MNRHFYSFANLTTKIVDQMKQKSSALNPQHSYSTLAFKTAGRQSMSESGRACLARRSLCALFLFDTQQPFSSSCAKA